MKQILIIGIALILILGLATATVSTWTPITQDEANKERIVPIPYTVEYINSLPETQYLPIMGERHLCGDS